MGSFGGAPKERRRRRAEKWSSKRVFWRVRFFSALLRFSSVLRANLKGAEKKRTLHYWTTISPHDAFAAPLARSEVWQCPNSKVPEGHHPRGTTLREALRGKFASQRALWGLSEGSAGVSPKIRRSLRGSAGFSEGFWV